MFIEDCYQRVVGWAVPRQHLYSLTEFGIFVFSKRIYAQTLKWIMCF